MDDGREQQQHSGEGGYRRVPTAQIEELTQELRQVRESLIRLESKVVPREYVDAQVEKRVLKDVYVVDQAALAERMARLEGHWTRLVPWLALGLSLVMALIQAGVR